MRLWNRGVFGRCPWRYDFPRGRVLPGLENDEDEEDAYAATGEVTTVPEPGSPILWRTDGILGET